MLIQVISFALLNIATTFSLMISLLFKDVSKTKKARSCFSASFRILNCRTKWTDLDLILQLSVSAVTCSRCAFNFAPNKPKCGYWPFVFSALLTASGKHFWTATNLTEKVAGGCRQADRGRAQENHIWSPGERVISAHGAAESLPVSGRHHSKGVF